MFVNVSKKNAEEVAKLKDKDNKELAKIYCLFCGRQVKFYEDRYFRNSCCGISYENPNINQFSKQEGYYKCKRCHDRGYIPYISFKNSTLYEMCAVCSCRRQKLIDIANNNHEYEKAEKYNNLKTFFDYNPDEESQHFNYSDWEIKLRNMKKQWLDSVKSAGEGV